MKKNKPPQVTSNEKFKIGEILRVKKMLQTKTEKNFTGKIKDIKEIFGKTDVILEDVHLDDDLNIRME